MSIPVLTAAGFLPPGSHDATLAEVEAVFGRFQETERRITLFRKLSEYIAELRSLGHAREVLLDGSFVTAKVSPGDIDLIVVYPEHFNFGANLTPAPSRRSSPPDSRRSTIRLTGGECDGCMASTLLP